MKSATARNDRLTAKTANFPSEIEKLPLIFRVKSKNLEFFLAEDVEIHNFADHQIHPHT